MHRLLRALAQIVKGDACRLRAVDGLKSTAQSGDEFICNRNVVLPCFRLHATALFCRGQPSFVDGVGGTSCFASLAR